MSQISNDQLLAMLGDTDQERIESTTPRLIPIVFHRGDPTKMPTKKNPNDPGLSWRGGYYISKEDAAKLPADMVACGWTEDSFVVQSTGKEIEVWYRPTLTVSALNCARRQWIVNLVENNTHYFPWSQGEQAGQFAQANGKSQNGKMHQPVIVKGMEEAGVMMLTFDGHAQMAFTGTGAYYATGVMTTFNRVVIAAANALAEKKAKEVGAPVRRWDTYSHWLTIGTSVNEDGTPKFTEVGKVQKSNTVLPVPVGLDAGKVDPMTLILDPQTFYQAREAMSNLISSGWSTAWDKPSSSNGKQSAATQPTATVNAKEAEEAGY